LEAAAVVGIDVVHLDQWQQLCQLSSIPLSIEQAAALMNQLARQALVRLDGDGFAWAHGMIVSVLEARSLGAGRWHTLQHRWASWLESQPDIRATGQHALHLIEAGEAERALEPLLEMLGHDIKRGRALAVLARRSLVE